MKASIYNLLVAPALSMGIYQAAAQGTWTNIASMPQSVIECSGVAWNGKFYIMNGFGNGAIVPPVVYDPQADSWSLKTADPANRSAAVASVISNKIYVAEGFIAADSNNSTKALEIYDPANDSWTAGASSLVARGTSSGAVIGGKLYITGGRAEYYLGDITTLEIYDPVSNTWTNGAPIPVAPEGAVGAAINGKFYVVGGYVRPANTATANVFIYDPATDTWTAGAPLPAPREIPAGDVINGKLYITGGTSSDGTNNPVMVYDPAMNSWAAATPEPTPRTLGAAAAINGRLFVAGGYPDGVFPGTATAEVFTPALQLNIVSTGNQSILFWPASGTNYVLQSTTNLASPNWVTASDAVPVIAFTVTNTSPARFFRLQSQ